MEEPRNERFASVKVCKDGELEPETGGLEAGRRPSVNSQTLVGEHGLLVGGSWCCQAAKGPEKAALLL